MCVLCADNALVGASRCQVGVAMSVAIACRGFRCSMDKALDVVGVCATHVGLSITMDSAVLEVVMGL